MYDDELNSRPEADLEPYKESASSLTRLLGSLLHSRGCQHPAPFTFELTDDEAGCLERETTCIRMPRLSM